MDPYIGVRSLKSPFQWSFGGGEKHGGSRVLKAVWNKKRSVLGGPIELDVLRKTLSHTVLSFKMWSGPKLGPVAKFFFCTVCTIVTASCR